jgi:hypothetical protein
MLVGRKHVGKRAGPAQIAGGDGVGIASPITPTFITRIPRSTSIAASLIRSVKPGLTEKFHFHPAVWIE